MTIAWLEFNHDTDTALAQETKQMEDIMFIDTFDKSQASFEIVFEKYTFSYRVQLDAES